MRVLIHEFVTGGGWFSVEETPPAGSLLAEGAAMRAAAVADFAALPGIKLSYLADRRLPRDLPSQAILVGSAEEEHAALAGAAKRGTAIVLIAPEFNGHLLRRCRLVESLGGQLLSPDSGFVELGGDKQATTERLRAAGVGVPPSVAFRSAKGRPFAEQKATMVIKPRDGAGSLAVRRIEDEAAAQRHIADHPHIAAWHCEEYCPGLAASIAAIGGPRGWLLLPPGRQLLSNDGEFHYLGGEIPLEPPLAERAERLALAALAALPPTSGYLGLDLILGPDEAGTQDVVIEINPRLTTSYIGLRRAVRENLAGLWLTWLRGESVEYHATAERVRFLVDS